MRIRPLRSPTTLATSVVRKTIIGDGDDNSYSNFGYRQTDGGIEASFSFARSSPSYRISALDRVVPATASGYTYGAAQSGQVYAFFTDDMSEFSVLIANLGKNVRFSGFPAYDGERTFTLVGGNTICIVNGLSSLEKLYLPFTARCGCFHAERLFVADNSEDSLVRWSGTTLNDWTQSADGAGYVRLDPSLGKIVNMYSFKDRVVVFREYGITVLRALGDPRNYAVGYALPSGFSAPMSNPYAVACDDKLFFAAGESIFSFDGSALRNVTPVRKEGLHSFARPSAYEDRYLYFECKTRLSTNSYVLEYDLVTGYTALFGENVDNFWRDGQGAHCFKSTYFMSDMFGGGDMLKRWTSKDYDLGTGGIKTLKSVFVSGTGDCTVTVCADGAERAFAGFGQHRAGMRGSSFTFVVSGECDVDRLEAEWEVTA